MDKRKKAHNIDTILLQYYERKAGHNSLTIAEQLGISRGSYLNKRKGYTPFTAPEMFNLIEILQIPDEDIKQIFNPKDFF